MSNFSVGSTKVNTWLIVPQKLAGAAGLLFRGCIALVSPTCVCGGRVGLFGENVYSGEYFLHLPHPIHKSTQWGIGGDKNQQCADAGTDLGDFGTHV
jgi:hypothetical protein